MSFSALTLLAITAISADPGKLKIVLFSGETFQCDRMVKQNDYVFLMNCVDLDNPQNKRINIKTKASNIIYSR